MPKASWWLTSLMYDCSYFNDKISCRFMFWSRLGEKWHFFPLLWMHEFCPISLTILFLLSNLHRPCCVLKCNSLNYFILSVYICMFLTLGGEMHLPTHECFMTFCQHYIYTLASLCLIYCPMWASQCLIRASEKKIIDVPYHFKKCNIYIMISNRFFFSSTLALSKPVVEEVIWKWSFKLSC